MVDHNEYYVFGESISKQPVDLNYAEFMLKRFSNFKDNVAIIDAISGAKRTYGQISDLAYKVAVALNSIGVRKGQLVAICAEESLETIPTVLGIMYIGATFTFIDTVGPATIVHRMNLVKPEFLISTPQAYQAHRSILQQPCVKTTILYGNDHLDATYTFSELLAKAEGIIQPCSVNGLVDLATLGYSSGTTGLSKGVPITHMSAVSTMNTHVDLSYYKGKIVLIAPNFVMMWFAFLYSGATTVFMQNETHKDIVEAVHKYKVDSLQQMPTTVAAVVRSPFISKYDLSSLTRLLCCSSPLTPQLVKEIHDKIPSIKAVYQLYGATEVGGITSDEIEIAAFGPKPNSVGCVVPGVVVKVVDLKTNEVLGPNQRGEICAKFDAPVPAYLGVESADHIDSDGFYKTGDIGYYDEDRYFYLVDRIKDIIKYHGYAVSPMELEMVLLKHPSVLEAAVVGAVDDQYDELPTACVVLRAGVHATPDEITQFVNDQVSFWMRLAGGTVVLEQMPRGKRGKIDRKTLRKLVQALLIK